MISARSLGDAPRFDELLLALHAGTAADRPWESFLGRLCEAAGACAASLVLRPPAQGDRGELFDARTTRSLVEIYRSRAYEDDPFADLPEGEVCLMGDLVSPEQLLETRYHRELLAPDNIVDMLGLNVGFGDRHVALFRVARRASTPPFGLLERSLMARLYPHLRCALAAYDRERRQAIENRAYARALDQLALGVLIIDDRGEVARLNETAARLVRAGTLRIVEQELRLPTPAEDQALAALIAANLAAGRDGPEALDWLRLSRDGDVQAHLLLKPIRDEAGEDARPLGIAIYVAPLDRTTNITPAACAKMFGLTRAEAALLLELLAGGSIHSASQSLGISESTARTQLRAMFAKTGTHRQTDLVRLILTSLAAIA